MSLGDQPHCNRFLRPDQLSRPEPKYPLDLYLCNGCSLVQLGFTVPAEKMFKDYPYVSGTTATLRGHFKESAQRIANRARLRPGGLVVDIGSNDGTFLQEFKTRGYKVLGVDPATAIVRQANASGIPTIEGFFDATVANQIAQEHGQARVITAAGVFFHIDDLHSVMRGIDALLERQGSLVIQAIYLPEMLKQGAYDQIYHEHLCYYTVTSLNALLTLYGFGITHVRELPIHGGSIEVYARRGYDGSAPTKRRFMRDEAAMGLRTAAPYLAFAERATRNTTSLYDIVKGLNCISKTVYAYGAPAKGNTLLNYVGLGPEWIQYAIEKNPLKFDTVTPGTQIPVVDERLTDVSILDGGIGIPDYYLLLPWNFKDEILAKEQAFRDRGGKFIIPIPEPHIV
jgi:SAM-dependent methyltransferase